MFMVNGLERDFPESYRRAGAMSSNMAVELRANSISLDAAKALPGEIAGDSLAS